jgi:RNA recognition motif-containing protein
MNIYVGNLSRTATETTLRELFEQFGQVTSIKVIIDKFTGTPRGFAFVEMPVAAEAQQAIAQLNGQNVEGQTLRVNEARAPEAGAGRSPRPGGGSRFGGRSNGPRGPRTGGYNNNSWNR